MIASKTRVSVRQKIILLTCAMTIFASCLLGTFAFFRVAQVTVETALDGLAGETRLIALKFKGYYDQMSNDTFIVHQTPPVAAILRSADTGIDPLEGSTLSQWQARLETIFTSVMEARPHYTQMRFIGIADGGRELVRVNRTKSELTSVGKNALQRKADEPYFKKALSLEPDQIYFSEMTYNREFGEVGPEMVATVRTIMPVFDQGAVVGMIVINADYPLMLTRAFKEIAPDKRTYVVNHSGTFFEYEPQTGDVSYELGNEPSVSPPAFVDQVKTSTLAEQTFHGDDITHFVKLAIDSSNADASLAIGLEVPKRALLASAYRTQFETFLLAVVIGLISLAVAIFVAGKITRPLRNMTTQLQDEIGDLARAFQTLTQNLQKKEAESRAVLNNVVDGILTIGKQGEILSFNPACEKIFGYSAREVIGKNIRVLNSGNMPKTDDDNVWEYWRNGQEKFLSGVREMEGRRKDGTLFALEISVSEFKTTDTHIYTWVVRDITARQQMIKMKDEFISTVNHELRTPLTSIQTSLALLNVDLQHKLDPSGKRILHLADKNCRRLSNLVNDILDIEKIAAGKMDYAIEEVDIVELVKDIVGQNQPFASRHKSVFVFKTMLENVTCKVDPNRFSQALTNLLSNAAKFSPDGDEVLVRLASNGTEAIRISVIDHGHGIPEDFKDKIFEKFAQADGSSTRAKGGTGLGLNITKSIIEAFDGTVSFKSEEGKGATFSFDLPICRPHMAERKAS